MFKGHDYFPFSTTWQLKHLYTPPLDTFVPIAATVPRIGQQLEEVVDQRGITC